MCYFLECNLHSLLDIGFCVWCCHQYNTIHDIFACIMVVYFLRIVHSFFSDIFRSIYSNSSFLVFFLDKGTLVGYTFNIRFHTMAQFACDDFSLYGNLYFVHGTTGRTLNGHNIVNVISGLSIIWQPFTFLLLHVILVFIF